MTDEAATALPALSRMTPSIAVWAKATVDRNTPRTKAIKCFCTSLCQANRIKMRNPRNHSVNHDGPKGEVNASLSLQRQSLSVCGLGRNNVESLVVAKARSVN